MINNAFLCGDTADRFSYIVIRPHGTGHSISGLDNTGDTFRAVNGKIGRVDTSFSDVVYSKLNNIRIEGKSFHNIKLMWPILRRKSINKARLTAHGA